MKILAGTLPLSADPGKVFFIISILKQSSRYRRWQRNATPRYRYDFYWVPLAIVFFAAYVTWFNQGAFSVVKPLKSVFCYLKGRGPLKKIKALRECRVIKGPSIDTTHTPPLFSFYTTFKGFSAVLRLGPIRTGTYNVRRIRNIHSRSESDKFTFL